jgi:hypothetical protein
MNIAAFRSLLLASACSLILLSGCSGKPDTAAPDTGVAASSVTNSAVVTSPASATASSADAAAPAYEATLKQGIDFSKTGYPSFLTDMSGVSNAETWGRWTDVKLGAEAKFRFKQALPQQFKLVLEVKDFYGTNAGQNIVVRVGEKQQEFMFDSADKTQHVELTFSNVGTTNTIEIIAPKHTEPTATDSRMMSLGLVLLKILP